jgi:hypothetical protein
MITKSRTTLKLLPLCLLIAVLLAAILPNTSLAAGKFADIEGHWAEENINTWVDQGLVKGYDDGTFKPNEYISRAEFMVLINRAYGFNEKAPVAFTDVSAGSWYYNDVAIAIKAGYIAGYSDQTMKPNNPISRQEVAAILARLLDIEGRAGSIEQFKDYTLIPDWSKSSINAVVTNGYMGGYPDGTFAPNKLTTRAEIVTILSRAVGALYNEAGEYGPEAGIATITTNVTVTADGVKLQNMKIAGDLYLTPAIGEGDVHLKNVTVEGRTIVAGGGEESVIFEDSTLGIVVMKKEDGKVRVVLEGNSSAVNVTVKSGGKIEITGADGSIATVDIETDDEIELAGNIDTLNIEKENAKINIAAGTINKLNIEEGAAGATVKGQGNILVAFISTNATLEKQPEESYVKQGATANIAGQEIEGDKTEEEMQEAKETVTIPEGQVPAGPARPPAGGGGGGDDAPSVIPVSAISVDPDIMLLKVGQTETIAVTVSPSNATNKRVTWSSSDESVATVDENGEVTAIAGGTATIIVTSAADSTKKATKQVIVGDLLVPANGSIQEVIDEAENGDVIAVAPSIYEEQLVIDKPLTLLGPNAVFEGYGQRNGEAVITYPDDIEDEKLIRILSDDVEIKGLYFQDGGKTSGNLEAILAKGDNLLIKNNVFEGFSLTQMRLTPESSSKGFNVGFLIEGNLFKNKPIGNFALYIQGSSGVARLNKFENVKNGLTVQPYHHSVGGVVEDNEIEAWYRGIWFNGAYRRAGEWVFNNNTVNAIESPNDAVETVWYGIRVETFGDGGPLVTGDLPSAKIINNTVDGAGASSGVETIGISLHQPIYSDLLDIENNEFTNVDIGGNIHNPDGPKYMVIDLNDFFPLNTFLDGSQVIGNKIMVPEEGKVYNQRTGNEYDTIQAAVIVTRCWLVLSSLSIKMPSKVAAALRVKTGLPPQVLILLAKSITPLIVIALLILIVSLTS